MDYLEMAINESMRLLPTAPRLERSSKKTVELNGVTIPKDTLVGIPVYVLCRDPQLWESPDEFRPERWCLSLHLSFFSQPQFFSHMIISQHDLYSLQNHVPDSSWLNKIIFL